MVEELWLYSIGGMRLEMRTERFEGDAEMRSGELLRSPSLCKVDEKLEYFET